MEEEIDDIEINSTSDSDEEYVVAAAKRKAEPLTSSEENHNKGKRKTLKDNPRPIITPAIRKKKEKEIAENVQGQSFPNQLHTSIIAQPSIDKEKAIEKELRDEERGNPSTSLKTSSNEEQIEIEELMEKNQSKINEEKLDKTDNTLSKLV